jgi:hypothetical protein
MFKGGINLNFSRTSGFYYWVVVSGKKIAHGSSLVPLSMIVMVLIYSEIARAVIELGDFKIS